MDNVQSNSLEELKGSEFQIEDGMPNIQGWNIEDIQEERVGKVRDLLFDKNTRKVRYIITKLEGDDQEVLIPIENVELNTSESRVIVRLTLGQLFGLPTYIAGDISTEDEDAIQNIFRSGEEKEGGAGHTIFSRDIFYEEESSNQDRFYPKQGEHGTRTNLRSDQNAGGTGDIDPTGEIRETKGKSTLK